MGKYNKRILLALDGSDQAFQTAGYVSLLLPAKNVEVTLFHVMSKVPESFWDIEKNPVFRHRLAPVAAWAMQQEKALQECMEKSRRLFVDRGIPENAVRIKIQERQVGIARDIAREAQNNYDAVVVGRWGISKLKDLVWGSIANKLIGHMVHTPLWVVGTSPQPGKVLLAMDGSEEAMRTVDYVGAMLQGTEWEVTLFHVIREFDFLSVGYEGSVAPIQQVTVSGEGAGEYLTAEEAIHEIFENAMDRLRKAGINGDLISTKVMTGVTSRAKAIVEEARTGDYGTIVVGRRGLSRVEEFLMGRVSNKVAQLAKEPAVWIVG